jgi:hypothetical protein
LPPFGNDKYLGERDMKDRRFSKKAVCEALNVPYNSKNCKEITLKEGNLAYVGFYHSGVIQFHPVYEGYEEVITHYSL